MQIEEILSDKSSMERLRWLENHADDITEADSYERPITEEEEEFYNREFVKESIQLNKEREILKAYVKDAKEEMKPLEKSTSEKLEILRTKKIKEHGQLFHIRDFDSNNLLTYNEKGQLVATRRLKLSETQATIFSNVAKTGS